MFFMNAMSVNVDIYKGGVLKCKICMIRRWAKNCNLGNHTNNKYTLKYV